MIYLDRNLVIVYEITYWFKRENYYISINVRHIIIEFDLKNLWILS
jgi:hypothetical protein